MMIHVLYIVDIVTYMNRKLHVRMEIGWILVLRLSQALVGNAWCSKAQFQR